MPDAHSRLVPKRAVKLIALVGLVLLIACVLFGYVGYRAPFADINAELAAMRAAGEPIDWEQIIPKAVPAEQNAAPLYEQAFALLNEGTEREKQLHSAWNRELTAQEWWAVDSLLQKNQRALQFVRQAAQRPRCIFAVDWSNPLTGMRPQYAKLRECARLLTAEARQRKRQGNIDGAAESLRTAMRPSDHLADDPQMLITYLVRLAIDTIALGNLERTLSDTEASRADYRAALNKVSMITPRRDLAQAFVHERLVSRFAYRLLYMGRLDELGEAARPPIGRIPLVVRWWVARDEAFALRAFRRMIGEARHERLDWQGINQLNELEQQARRHGCLIIAQLLPVFVKMFPKAAQGQARVDATRLALALRLYRLDHGDYPATLDALAPNYLSKVPLDPFTNKPFVYKREGKGSVVYSLGPNQRDDGGAFDPKNRDAGDMPWRSKI